MRKLFLLLSLFFVALNGNVVYGQSVAAMPLIFKTVAAGGYTYQTETNTYLAAETAAGKTFTTQQTYDIDTFFRDMKGLTNPRYTTYNDIANLILVYPFLTGVAAYDAINCITPGTYDYTTTGTPTYSTVTLSVAFNGSSNYLNTGFTPGNTGNPTAFSGMGIHRIDANNDGDGTVGVVSTGNSYFLIRNDVNRQMYIATNRSDASTGSLAIASYWQTSWSSSTVINAYRNGGNIKSTSGASFNNTGNTTIYIGAYHGGGGPVYGGATTVDFFVLFKSTWADANETAFYDAINNLKSSFGITW